MFSNILVAVDGSESANKAFQRAIYLAQKCNSKLDLVHVVQCEVGGDSANTFEIIEDLKDKAMKMLEEYRIEAAKSNTSMQITIMQGDPAKVIIELAKAKSLRSYHYGDKRQVIFSRTVNWQCITKGDASC